MKKLSDPIANALLDLVFAGPDYQPIPAATVDDRGRRFRRVAASWFYGGLIRRAYERTR